jgi:hypothetical protein
VQLVDEDDRVARFADLVPLGVTGSCHI